MRLFAVSACNRAGGATRDDIASIDRSNKKHERPAGGPKRKFGEFKSMSRISLAKHKSSGEDDPDSLVHFINAKSYIMYTFCFLKMKPLQQPLATRTLAGDAQWEEGFGGGVTPNSDIGHENGQKRKREKQKISIVRMESLSSVFRPFSDEVGHATEDAETDKVVYEAAETKARSAQSLLAAIKRAKDISLSVATREEKLMYQGIANKIMGNRQKIGHR